MSLKSLVEKIPGYNQLVRPLHWLQAARASVKYDFPAKKLRVIAVTGTNGKTTTCFMIWKMLNEAGRKTGLLTTVGWSEDGEHMHKQFEHMTTERVEVLNKRMRAVADAGSEFLVLETTSHAMMQFRTLGVPVEIAVFTNLTHEHLDYHKTFENYRKAKLKLFEKAKYGVVNADDPSAEWFTAAVGGKVLNGAGASGAGGASRAGSGDIGDMGVKSIKSIKSVGDYASGDIMTYGIEKGELRATGVKLSATGVEYACGDMKDLKVRSAAKGHERGAARAKDALHIKTQIPGKFNVYNSLAAVAVGKKVGLTKQQIERGIFALTEVEGRMTRIREGQDFEVIVDYAHAPDALEKVFESVGRATDKVAGKVAGRKIISVHGGAGRRDPSTREIRGEILGKNSDIVIITEDDSRDEDPAEIAAMFVTGAEKVGKVKEKDLFVELDRRKAIEKAIRMARKGDLVLLLGKGHEKTILRADGPHDFEDIKVAREAIRKSLRKRI